jgi:hypothetical protein
MELMVHDNAAMYRARAVELTSEERSRIVRVVLGALRRTLEEQYAEVAGPPRKRRKNLGSGLKAVESAIGNDAGVQDAHALPTPPSLSSPRKIRGRPKKVRQALDGTLVPE